MRENRRVCRAFVGKPEENNQLEDLNLGWEGSIKIDLKEMVWRRG